MGDPRGHAFRLDLREANGALGDIGTLLPLALGVIALTGLSPPMVRLGFGLFYIATGLVYRLPIPAQPMKAIAAVVLLGVALAALRVGTHAAMLTIATGVGAGMMLGLPKAPVLAAAPWPVAIPDAQELRRAVTDMALPQLALTLTNAVVLTSLIAGDLFGARGPCHPAPAVPESKNSGFVR